MRDLQDVRPQDVKAGPDVEVRAYARQVRAALADVPNPKLGVYATVAAQGTVAVGYEVTVTAGAGLKDGFELKFNMTSDSTALQTIFLLTGGAAGTEVVSVRVYELLTVQRNVGAAAAQSVLLAAVLVVLLGAYLWLLRRREGARS